MSVNLQTYFNIFFLFVFAMVLMVIPIAPTNFDLEKSNNFYPDLLTCFVFSILLNRPKLCPSYIILIIYILSDIILMRPIGLFCALIFIVSELIRRYSKAITKETFLIHWFIFLSCLLAVHFLNIIVHKLFFMPYPQVIFLAKQLAVTTLFYPLFDLPLKFFLRKET